MNLLICGDSFAADWTVKYPGKGWPNMLADQYNVTNLAQAGCSEYKILKQLKSVDLMQYDQIIIAHTSPYRIHVQKHPIHHTDLLHKNCDLIYTDLVEHAIKHKELVPVIDYFKNYFDTDYAKDIHTLLCQEIERLIAPVIDRVISTTNSDYEGLYQFKNMIKFDKLFASNRGLMNHYDEAGNQKIFEILSTTLLRKLHGKAHI